MDLMQKIKLTGSRFKIAEQMRNSWVCSVEPGTSLEQVLDTAFFANYAKLVGPWDKIEINCEDGAFYAELLVVQSGTGWVKCQVLQSVDLQAPIEVDEQCDFEIKYTNRYSNFRVIRKSDKKVVQDNLQTKADAAAWLAGHLKTIG